MVVKSQHHHGHDLGRPPKPRKMLSSLAGRLMRKKSNQNIGDECHSPRYAISQPKQQDEQQQHEQQQHEQQQHEQQQHEQQQHEQQQQQTSKEFSFREEQRDDDLPLNSRKEATASKVIPRLEGRDDHLLLNLSEDAATTQIIQRRVRRFLRSNKKAFRDPEVRFEVTRLYNLIKHVNDDKRDTRFVTRRTSTFDGILEEYSKSASESEVQRIGEPQKKSQKKMKNEHSQQNKQPRKQLRVIMSPYLEKTIGSLESLDTNDEGEGKPEATRDTPIPPTQNRFSSETEDASIIAEPTVPFCCLFSSFASPNNLIRPQDTGAKESEERPETVIEASSIVEREPLNESPWKHPTEKISNYISSALSSFGNAFYESVAKLESVQIDAIDPMRYDEEEDEEEEKSTISSAIASATTSAIDAASAFVNVPDEDANESADAPASNNSHTNVHVNSSISAKDQMLLEDKRTDVEKAKSYDDVKRSEVGTSVNARDLFRRRGTSLGRRFRPWRKNKNNREKKDQRKWEQECVSHDTRIQRDIETNEQEPENRKLGNHDQEMPQQQSREQEIPVLVLMDDATLETRKKPMLRTSKDMTQEMPAKPSFFTNKFLDRRNSINSSKASQKMAKELSAHQEIRDDNQSDEKKLQVGESITRTVSHNLEECGGTLDIPATQEPRDIDNKPNGAQEEGWGLHNDVANQVTPATLGDPLDETSSDGHQQLELSLEDYAEGSNLEMEQLKRELPSEQENIPVPETEPPSMRMNPSLKRDSSLRSQKSFRSHTSLGSKKSHTSQSKEELAIKLSRTASQHESALKKPDPPADASRTTSHPFAEKATNDSRLSYLFGYLLAQLASQQDPGTQHENIEKRHIPVPKKGSSLLDILNLLQTDHSPRLSKGFLTFILAEFTKQVCSVDKDALQMGYMERLLARPAALVSGEQEEEADDAEISKSQGLQACGTNTSLSAVRSVSEQSNRCKDPIELTTPVDVTQDAQRSKMSTLSSLLFKSSSIQSDTQTHNSNQKMKIVDDVKPSPSLMKNSVGLSPFSSYFHKHCSCFSSELLAQTASKDFNNIALAVEHSVATMREDERDDVIDTSSSSADSENGTGAGTDSVAFSDIDAWFDFMELRVSTDSSTESGSKLGDKLPSFDVSEWMLQE